MPGLAEQFALVHVTLMISSAHAVVEVQRRHRRVITRICMVRVCKERRTQEEKYSKFSNNFFLIFNLIFSLIYDLYYKFLLYDIS
jgi:hypothetical protein